ncbi:MAG: hypothetical protein MJZ33_02955 [Paludibacteraceae bacterium]|nr:hypothetical protein [Paludibacteraceae bacterium]
MIKRVKSTKVGDVFEVVISDTEKRYMQYIASDLTQLNSDVLRVFKHIYKLNEKPTLAEIVSGNVDYYTHGDSKFGIKMEAWTLYGNINEIGDYSNVWFKCKRDYTNPENNNDWYVWKIGDSHISMDINKIKDLGAHLGMVNSYLSILYRLRTGHEEVIFAKYE